MNRLFLIIIRFIHNLLSGFCSRRYESRADYSILRHARRGYPISKKPSWYSQLLEEIDNLPLGKYLFNPASEMKVGVTERVELRITQNPGEELTLNLKGKGIPQIENLKVGSLMKARLTGTAFSIASLNEDEQLVTEKGYTEWSWDIIPQKSGMQNLHLHITVRIRLPFGEERKDHPVIDKKIEVQVNPIYSVKLFLSRYWKWIATAIILPIVYWLLKKYFGKA